MSFINYINKDKDIIKSEIRELMETFGYSVTRKWVSLSGNEVGDNFAEAMSNTEADPFLCPESWPGVQIEGVIRRRKREDNQVIFTKYQDGFEDYRNEKYGATWVDGRSYVERLGIDEVENFRPMGLPGLTLSDYLDTIGVGPDGRIKWKPETP